MACYIICIDKRNYNSGSSSSLAVSSSSKIDEPQNFLESCSVPLWSSLPTGSEATHICVWLWSVTDSKVGELYVFFMMIVVSNVYRE